MTTALSYAGRRAAKTVSAMSSVVGAVFLVLLFLPFIQTQALRAHDAIFPIVTGFEVLKSTRTDADQTVLVYAPNAHTPHSVTVPKDSLEIFGRFRKEDTTCEYKALAWYVGDKEDTRRRVAVIFADQPPAADADRTPDAEHAFGPWYVLDQGERGKIATNYVETRHLCDDGRVRRTLLEVAVPDAP